MAVPGAGRSTAFMPRHAARPPAGIRSRARIEDRAVRHRTARAVDVRAAAIGRLVVVRTLYSDVGGSCGPFPGRANADRVGSHTARQPSTARGERVASQMLGRISAAPARWYQPGASPSTHQAESAPYTGDRYSSSAVRAAPSSRCR